MHIALCAIATNQTEIRSQLFGPTTIIKHQGQWTEDLSSSPRNTWLQRIPRTDLHNWTSMYAVIIWSQACLNVLCTNIDPETILSLIYPLSIEEITGIWFVWNAGLAIGVGQSDPLGQSDPQPTGCGHRGWLAATALGRQAGQVDN